MPRKFQNQAGLDSTGPESLPLRLVIFLPCLWAVTALNSPILPLLSSCYRPKNQPTQSMVLKGSDSWCERWREPRAPRGTWFKSLVMCSRAPFHRTRSFLCHPETGNCRAEGSPALPQSPPFPDTGNWTWRVFCQLLWDLGFLNNCNQI